MNRTLEGHQMREGGGGGTRDWDSDDQLGREEDNTE